MLRKIRDIDVYPLITCKSADVANRVPNDNEIRYHIHLSTWVPFTHRGATYYQLFVEENSVEVVDVNSRQRATESTYNRLLTSIEAHKLYGKFNVEMLKTFPSGYYKGDPVEYNRKAYLKGIMPWVSE